MPKHARVALVMAAMIIFAIIMLDLVRSKVEASGRAIKAAATEYSTIKRIYVSPAEMVPSNAEQPGKPR